MSKSNSVHSENADGTINIFSNGVYIPSLPKGNYTGSWNIGNSVGDNSFSPQLKEKNHRGSNLEAPSKRKKFMSETVDIIQEEEAEVVLTSVSTSSPFNCVDTGNTIIFIGENLDLITKVRYLDTDITSSIASRSKTRIDVSFPSGIDPRISALVTNEIQGGIFILENENTGITYSTNDIFTYPQKLLLVTEARVFIKILNFTRKPPSGPFLGDFTRVLGRYNLRIDGEIYAKLEFTDPPNPGYAVDVSINTTFGQGLPEGLNIFQRVSSWYFTVVNGGDLQTNGVIPTPSSITGVMTFEVDFFRLAFPSPTGDNSATIETEVFFKAKDLYDPTLSPPFPQIMLAQTRESVIQNSTTLTPIFSPSSPTGSITVTDVFSESTPISEEIYLIRKCNNSVDYDII